MSFYVIYVLYHVEYICKKLAKGSCTYTYCKIYGPRKVNDSVYLHILIENNHVVASPDRSLDDDVKSFKMYPGTAFMLI